MMQLFCSSEDMGSGTATLKDSFNDCCITAPNNNTNELEPSPPYRSRCNTWPKLVRGLDSESDNPPPVEEAWGGGSLLPLVSEETDDLSEAAATSLSGSKSCVTPPNAESAQQFSTHASSTTSGASSTTRRNPWGNCSYADLITQAIQSSSDQRLTVSQIYEWLVKNISFFADKGDSNSSAGWKNSIRHNLSLHPKFVRVQNEGTGKSSWWIINPDVKPGVKPSRRRAMSMETSSARQRKNNLGAARAKRRNVSGDHHFHHPVHSNSSQLERTLSSGSLPPYDYSDHSDHFRPRSSSSASSFGRPGSPRTSSTDILSGKTPLTSGPWHAPSSLSPTLFNVVERLNLQDSLEETDSSAHQVTSSDNLDNITLNDLNLDYETTKLLDSFLTPSGEEAIKLEKEFVPIAQQKIKILEQRESTSRGSSMSTSTPSSPPGMLAYSNAFLPQPKIIQEDHLRAQPPPYYAGHSELSMDTMDTLFQAPVSSFTYPEQFKSFDDIFFEGAHTDNNNYSSTSSCIQGLSLNYFPVSGSDKDIPTPGISVNDNAKHSINKQQQLLFH